MEVGLETEAEKRDLASSNPLQPLQHLTPRSGHDKLQRFLRDNPLQRELNWIQGSQLLHDSCNSFSLTAEGYFKKFIYMYIYLFEGQLTLHLYLNFFSFLSFLRNSQGKCINTSIKTKIQFHAYMWNLERWY